MVVKQKESQQLRQEDRLPLRLNKINHVDEITQFDAQQIAQLKIAIKQRVIVDVDSGCWNWIDCKNRQGYGKVATWFSSTPAPRVSFVVFKNMTIGKLFVLHKCDNTACINPKHLFLGTCKDNMEDCKSKGRLDDRRGEKNTVAKLTKIDVVEIRRLADLGENYSAIAYKFGVSRSHISGIVSRKWWKHV